ncbi:hypothetical protein C8Q79DRAFT_633078 [Trametes meyenii]|nr:hypothetical protein C8Q79DRAFT_633078 [Trametes meyenii]
MVAQGPPSCRQAPSLPPELSQVSGEVPSSISKVSKSTPRAASCQHTFPQEKTFRRTTRTPHAEDTPNYPGSQYVTLSLQRCRVSCQVRHERRLFRSCPADRIRDASRRVASQSFNRRQRRTQRERGEVWRRRG